MAIAPVNPAAGNNSRKLHSAAFTVSPAIAFSVAGSPGRNETSTKLSERVIPSPVALSNASFRVHKLKNAAGFRSSGTF